MRRQAHLRLLDVEIVPEAGVPKTVVERAVEKVKAARKDARRMKDANLAYDEAWCIFDIDEHPNVEDAKNQARDNNLHVAISNPCFELWLVLHFQDQTAHEHRHNIQRTCSQDCLPGFKKQITLEMYGLLTERYSDAVRRAAWLDNWHESRGTSGSNPSTQVYKLTERLLEIASIEQHRRSQ
jgi:hypothetical protein